MSLFEILFCALLGGFVAGACDHYYGPFFAFLGGIVGFTFFGLYAFITFLLEQENKNKALISLLSFIVMFLAFYINHIFFYSDNYLDSIWGVRQMLLNYMYILIMVYILWKDHVRRYEEV